jgi:hypothetical protein
MNALAQTKTDDQTHAWQLNPGCYGQLRGGCWIKATDYPKARSLAVVFVKPGQTEAAHGTIPDTTLVHDCPTDAVPAAIREAMAKAETERNAKVAERDQKARQALAQWRIGQRVTFAGRGGAAVLGTIVRISAKTATVAEDGSPDRQWRVTPGLLRTVAE